MAVQVRQILIIASVVLMCCHPLLSQAQDTEKKDRTVLNQQGRSELHLNFQQPQSDNTDLPSLYGYWTGRQQLTLYNLPFALQWNFISTQPQHGWIPNGLSLRFNTYRFRKHLKERAKDHIKRKVERQKAKLTEWKKYDSKSEEINTVLKNQQVKKEIQQLKRLDSLEKTLEQKKDKWDGMKQAKVQERIDALEHLKQKRKVYEHLLEERQRLDSLKKGLGQIDSLRLKSQYDYSRLNDRNILKKELNASGYLSRWEELAMSIEQLEVGRISPAWHPLLLHGATIDGANVAISPKNMHVGGVAGDIFPSYHYGQLQVQDSMLYDRNVVGVVGGYGNQNDNFIRAGFLQFKDQGTEVSHINQPSPKSNHVIHMVGGWSGWDDKIQVRAFIAGSQTTYNILANQEQSIHVGNINVTKPTNSEDWFTNILYQRNNSLNFATGYSLDGDIKFNPFKAGPDLIGKYRRISSDYQSFGVPFLRNDYDKLEGGLKQSFLKNKLSLFLSYSQYNDNLSDHKPFSTKWHQYNFKMRFSEPGFPNLVLSYQPMLRNNYRKYWIHLWNLQGTYFYKKRQWESVINMMYSFYVNQNVFSAHTVALHSILKTPLSVKAIINSTYYNRSYGDGNERDLFKFSVMPICTVWNNWENGVGWNFYTGGISQPKNGIVYESSVGFLNNFKLSVQLEYDRYNNSLDNSDQGYGFFVRSNLSAKW